MQEGCSESAEFLLREAMRENNIDLLVKVNQAYKRGWEDLESRASAATMHVSFFGALLSDKNKRK